MNIIPIDKKTKRYVSHDRKRALSVMNEKNKLAGKNIWKTAVCIDNRILFDIDTDNIDNVTHIYKYYSKLFSTEFRIIKSYHGYHLISTRKYGLEEKVAWQYDLCRVLYPILERNQLQNYLEGIEKFISDSSKKSRLSNENRQTFLDRFSNEFRNQSGLYCGIGEFDIYFCMNVLVRGHYCIRISKKSVDDNPVDIII